MYITRTWGGEGVWAGVLPLRKADFASFGCNTPKFEDVEPAGKARARTCCEVSVPVKVFVPCTDR